MSAPICKHAASGCDYPAGECQGACVAQTHCECEEPGHIIGGNCTDCGYKFGHREPAPKINAGGAAFPLAHDVQPTTGYDREIYVESGMSLRDYFAAKAMQGAFTGSPIPCTTDEHAYIAMHAYRMADAMLAAREKLS